MTRQEFVDAQINAALSTQKSEEQRAQRNTEMLKKALPPEDFEKMMAAEDAAVSKARQQMAKCLEISEQTLRQHEESFNTKFQIELIKTCATKLPDIISLTGNEWGANADLTAFQTCAETEIAKRTEIPEQRLYECSQQANEEPRPSE